MDRNERARIVRAPARWARAHPTADPPPARRAARGPRWKSGALLRASKSRSIAVPTRAGVALLWERRKPRCFCAQERAALPPGSPCGPASGWRTSPKGRAHDARAFVAVHGWTVNEARNPIAQSAGRSPLTGSLGVPFSLVTFSWARKRKLPARRKRAENTGMWLGHHEEGEPALHAPASGIGESKHRDAGRTCMDADRFSRNAGRTRTDAGRFSREKHHPKPEMANSRHHPHPTLPLKGRAEARPLPREGATP